jgi:16S rRNA (cytosine967-C5)-methyltransferase
VFDALERDGAAPASCTIDGCIQAGAPSVAIKSASLLNHHLLVVDAGAQFAAHAAHAAAGQRIVDFGAGRGTKTLLLAADAYLAGGVADIVAVDTHAFKLESLMAVAERSGAKGISVVVADATMPDAPGMPAPQSVDTVLVDAPCSGLGTLRRHPDRRWRAKPDEIETLAVLGGRLIQSAATLVKPGGFVVYSTCTIASAENAEVVESFLGSAVGAEFEIDSLEADAPDQLWRFLTPEGYFQSLPEHGGADGHFVARMRRRVP